MEQQKLIKEENCLPEFQKESFKYQLECLKLELDLVDRAIARLETITQNVKNFSVVVWVASITIFLGQSELRKYVAFTAILPILFWFIDAWWVHFHRGSYLRIKKIQEFLNSEDLTESFKQQKLINFKIIDVLGSQYRGTQEYEVYTSVSRIMKYRELFYLYTGLAISSIILEIIVLLTSK
ncbi:MAG: hypothetical protein KAF91_11965 [Nostoc sp. TH1S01]|nr:hypothetical protein [Nostoc sp. TH1S01]